MRSSWRPVDISPPPTKRQVGQLAFDGVVAEHAPLHWIVPELVWPHEFGALVQGLPRFGGFAGVLAEQLPAQLIVPLLVCPHALGALVQGFP